MLFFKPRTNEDTYRRVAERIRKDLIAAFQNKGINIRKVQVDMKSGSMNLEVLISEK